MEVIFEIEYRSQPVTSNTVTKWRPTGGRSAANGGPTVR